MCRFSLREFMVVLVGMSASFATGFFPVEIFAELGPVFYLTTVSSLLSGICAVAVTLVKRFAITIGVLFTVAAAIGVFIKLTADPSEPKDPRIFLFFLGALSIGPLLITVPLTIHRLTGSITRE